MVGPTILYLSLTQADCCMITPSTSFWLEHFKWEHLKILDFFAGLWDARPRKEGGHRGAWPRPHRVSLHHLRGEAEGVASVVHVAVVEPSTCFRTLPSRTTPRKAAGSLWRRAAMPRGSLRPLRGTRWWSHHHMVVKSEKLEMLIIECVKIWNWFSSDHCCHTGGGSRWWWEESIEEGSSSAGKWIKH